MKRMWNLLGGLLALAVVGAVVVSLMLIFRSQGSQPAPQQPSSKATATAVNPPPTPQPTYRPPTWTPVPPWTPSPQPSPTRRPGPTATPFPTRGPGSDPAGTILYTAPDRQAIMALTVDGQGRKVAEPAPLSLSLDFNPVYGVPSPDGRYLLVLRQSEPGHIPYVVNLESGRVWPLFGQESYANGILYGWHPNSRQVLFYYFDVDLRLVNVETGEYTILAFTHGPQGAAMSPDGQDIVYVAESSLSYRTMWKVSAAGSDAQPLFELGGSAYVFGWSPDGSSILYVGEPITGFIKGATPPGGPLWLMDPQGQNRRPLSGPFIFGWGFEPVWSPDGQWVALVGRDEGQVFGCSVKRDPPPDSEICRYEGAAIYIENILTGEVRRLAPGIEPVWSPDGSMLAFLSRQSGTPEVWVIRADGTGLQQLTADGQQKWRVTWTPTRR